MSVDIESAWFKKYSESLENNRERPYVYYMAIIDVLMFHRFFGKWSRGFIKYIMHDKISENILEFIGAINILINIKYSIPKLNFTLYRLTVLSRRNY